MTAFRCEPDEAYNAMKALLGWHGSGGAWSDQPPLLSSLHVGLFTLFGPSIGVLRCLELVFSGSLMVSLLAVLARSGGWFSGVGALALLGLSSEFWRLSLAVLVGLPAYAWAMMACASLVCGACSRPLLWVPLSGFLLGLGAQTKMSALLAAPAILVWLWCRRRSPHGGRAFPRHAIARWLAGFAVSSIGVWLLVGGSLTTIITTHWGSATRAGFAQGPAPAVLIGRLLLENWLLTILALLGLLTGIVKRRSDTLIPGLWFLTALLVHLWHRPFWQQHFLHLAVPMAWLAGLFIGEMVKQFKAVTWERLMGKPAAPSPRPELASAAQASLAPSGGEGLRVRGQTGGSTESVQSVGAGCPLIPAFSPDGGEGGVPGASEAEPAGMACPAGERAGQARLWSGARFSQAAAWCWVVLPSFFVSAFIVELPGRWEQAIAFTKVDDSKDWECVEVMKQYQAQTKWVFADDALYPFHAGLLTPPEIAVLSNKRLRAGLITQPELLNLLVHYRAEQVLVRRHVFNERFMAYVRGQYTLVFEHGPLELYVRNDLAVAPPGGQAAPHDHAKVAQGPGTVAPL